MTQAEIDATRAHKDAAAIVDEMSDIPRTEWSSYLAGCKEIPACDLEQAISRLDAAIERYARLRGYLDARRGTGYGDLGHNSGVRYSNKLASAVRKALGFVRYRHDVQF